MPQKMFIKWFNGIRREDISLVGGKAANLGEMFSSFPIPDGFCITVNAFEKFLKAAQIKDKISIQLKKININNLKNIENVSKNLSRLILKSKMPKEVEEAIIADYSKINGFVAVRSSAVAEDMENASFAGQQATFLNVKGGKDLIKYVKECWASFYTSRAIIYRERNKFDHNPKMAVVVQKMVGSKKSGVVFTVNPVTKNMNEMVIESIFGLGEAIVSGIVTPDNFVINKKTKRIISEAVNEKKIAIIRKDGKNKAVKLDSKKANEKSLSSKELKELVKECLNIERYYKKPMDIEWAIDGKLYILQARPITTL
ncbi:hypothetical protein HYS31_05380 [Candidatus Woesearchaeota archaeon]|nr:hypothetical protein [Candidatus Woesearchaeota archaeon]